LAKSWERLGVPVKIGGPAFGDRFGDFTPGVYLKHGYTFTSRGCDKHCTFCSVWRDCEGFRELEIKDGWNILDDNILCSSREHFSAVCEMLKRQPERPVFTGGIEPSYLTEWHAEKIREVKAKRLYCAYDTPDDLEPLRQAGKILRNAGFTRASHALACYVLIGFGSDTFEKAEKRLYETIDAGFVPYAMLYRNKGGKTNEAWRGFQREWCNPYIVGAKLKTLWEEDNHENLRPQTSVQPL